MRDIFFPADTDAETLAGEAYALVAQANEDGADVAALNQAGAFDLRGDHIYASGSVDIRGGGILLISAARVEPRPFMGNLYRICWRVQILRRLDEDGEDALFREFSRYREARAYLFALAALSGTPVNGLKISNAEVSPQEFHGHD